MAGKTNTYENLDGTLAVFRDSKFRSVDVFELVKHLQDGTELTGAVQGKYEALDAPTQERMQTSATALYEAYEQQKSPSGSPSDTMAQLEGDMQKICNFDGATPHFKARQGMESFLIEQKRAVDTPRPSPAMMAGKRKSTVEAPQAHSPQEADVPAVETSPAGGIAETAAAAAVAGAAAASARKDEPGKRQGKPEPSPTATKTPEAPPQAGKKEKPAPSASQSTGAPQNAEVQGKSRLHTAGVAAGTVAGLAATVEASRQWRDRVKKPEARKKAIAFASVAAISAIGVAAAIVMKRGNSGIGR